MSAATSFSNEARNLKDKVEDSANQFNDDAKTELSKLREQVETLMRERVAPALNDAAKQVGDYASRAQNTVEEKADSLAGMVREKPLTAVAVVAAGAYLLGWIVGTSASLNAQKR